MWKGRFQQATHSLLTHFGESVSYDWRLYRHDVAGSIAHAEGLHHIGLLNDLELQQIREGLEAIRDEIDAGNFQWDIALEDVHMNIEAALTKRIGAPGAKLHTARSRNDQIAVDTRLYLREVVDTLEGRIATLQEVLVALGETHLEVILPGYTHLQRAQPVPFAHHLLAYVEMLGRDRDRLADARKRIDIMPLGSGAIAGSTIAVPREFVAERLGFPALSRNSMDAVSDRDYLIELHSAFALLGMHLSRLSEDLILWSSSEFGFITLSDAFTTGSSLMPQKKNPDVAELARGKTGRLYGNLIQLLTVMKGLPLTYNRDMQEDKEALFDSIDTVDAVLTIFAAMLQEVTVHEDRIAAALADPLLLATDLADYLVLRGLPFRQAHEVIGGLVALANERKTPLNQLSLEDYQQVSALFEADVHDLFDVRRSIEARTATGAPALANVRRELSGWRQRLSDTP